MANQELTDRLKVLLNYFENMEQNTFTEKDLNEFLDYYLKSYNSRKETIQKWLSSRKPKKDWEVMAYENRKNDLYYKKKDGFYYIDSAVIPSGYSEKFISEIATIHSVRRLSDGEVWSVGDETNKGLITGFITIGGDMYASHSGVSYNICDLKRKPKPLFTTEDGKAIYTDGDYWGIDEDYSIHECSAGGFVNNRGWLKTFSTHQEAMEYVIENNPCLSYKDINNCRFDDDLKELIKSRIKQ